MYLLSETKDFFSVNFMKPEKIFNRRLLLQLSHYMGAVSMFCLYCVAGEKNIWAKEVSWRKMNM